MNVLFYLFYIYLQRDMWRPSEQWRGNTEGIYVKDLDMYKCVYVDLWVRSLEQEI